MNNAAQQIYSKSNLSVGLSLDQHTLITDSVTITNIEVSVDGNYLPSMETSQTLSSKHSLRSKYITLKKMKGLKKIKMQYQVRMLTLNSFVEWKDTVQNGGAYRREEDKLP